MNLIKATVIYILMLIAAVTDNKRMQTWLDGVIDQQEG